MKKTTLTTVFIFFAGLTASAQSPYPGVTLISPQNSNEAQMIDMDGTVLMTWHGSARPASFPYLLSDGSIVRPCMDMNGSFSGGGVGGRIQKIDAEDNLLWDFFFSNDDYQQHHDIQPMPNGNILLIAWERKTRQEAIDAGRQSIAGEMWPTLIVEIEPDGPTGGNIVWEWHLWDHLVQDVDPNKPNYGAVVDHPELIDINYGNLGGPQSSGDWIHVNSIDYNEQVDQIVFSSRSFNEIYIIDHSTTTEEAAGHTGGNSGMGGDILYRWGNPAVYGRGSSADQRFDVVHGINWVDCGLPGAGNLLAFNNGDRPGSANDYSSVLEITPPLDENGTYAIDDGEAFGPSDPAWYYEDTSWYAGATQCGAFRLPNGNTIITAAESGYVFEVTSSGTTVWEYEHPTNVPRAPRYWIADLMIFSGFKNAMTGPGELANGETHDYDCDSDIDLKDFAYFQATFGTYVGP